MRGNVKRRLAAFTALVLGMGSGLFVASGSEAVGPKSYTATAGTPMPAGNTQTATITFANTSRNNISFNAINVAVPSALTATNPNVGQPGASAQMNSTGTTIELRELNTPAGGKVILTFTLALAIQPSCTAYTFVSDVRQSNDFNGQNNTFVLDGGYASMTLPCSSSTVICAAGDNKPCTTGTIQSVNGNAASVVVNDGDGASATLTASLVAANFTCAEYLPTSDRLNFNIAITSSSLANVTKTVTFSRQVDQQWAPWQYQACFQAPYPFKALLPSQLAQDFAAGDFSNNTFVGNGTAANPTGTYTGLLLPCSAGYGVPCLGNPLNLAQPGVTITPISGTTSKVSITVTAPALDPGMRF